jgi:transcriptional regulator with XRE-family HTH domain
MKKAITSKQYSNLIAWLKEARLANGWSMREFAEHLDEPHSFVQKVESLERKLDVYQYTLYSKALGLNPEDGMKFFN